MGYALECALKASIAKQIKENDFPDKKLVNDSYTHDLRRLLDTSGLKQELQDAMDANPHLELNWSIAKDWSEGARYRHDITEPMARDIIDACTTEPDGVYHWIEKIW